MALIHAIDADGNEAAVKISELSAAASTTELQQTIIEHIPSTAIANPVTAASWINREDYTSGRVELTVPATMTGAATMQIAYSIDGGVTSSEWTTIYTFTGSTAETGVVEYTDFTAGADAAGFTKKIKAMPFFKIRLSGGGGTGNIVCRVTQERRK